MSTENRQTEAEKIAQQIWETILDFSGPPSMDTLSIKKRIFAALLAAEQRGAASERTAWMDCIKDLGPLLAKAKADGLLDALIAANIWPVPPSCISDADMQNAVEEAIRIRSLTNSREGV